MPSPLFCGQPLRSLSKLEDSELVSIEKAFVGKRPVTYVSLTDKGEDQIERHWRHLQSLRDGAREWTPEEKEGNIEKRGYRLVRREVREALGRLKPTRREILWLRECLGYSYAEMARALDIPLGTVMSRLHQARRCFKSRVCGGG